MWGKINGFRFHGGLLASKFPAVKTGNGTARTCFIQTIHFRPGQVHEAELHVPKCDGDRTKILS